MSRRMPAIAVLGGDGIGPEVTHAAQRVAEASGFDAEWCPGEVGWTQWQQHGNALPDDTIALLHDTDACLFGAIMSQHAGAAESALAPHLRDKGLRYESPILRIRQEMRLHTNIRPTTFYAGVPTPLAEPPKPNDDGTPFSITIFRENTEGLYAGCEVGPLDNTSRHALSTAFLNFSKRFGDIHDGDIAVTARVATIPATQRMLRLAFEHAQQSGLPSVTLAEKANVLRATGGLVLRTAEAMAEEYPALGLNMMNLDALATELVLAPTRHPCIAATNLFGDVLSDLVAGLAGGLGIAPSLSVGDTYTLAEPIHGSAPDIASTGRANPTGAILSVAHLAQHLDQGNVAQRIRAAVASNLRNAGTRTPDIGGTATTETVVSTIIDQFNATDADHPGALAATARAG